MGKRWPPNPSPSQPSIARGSSQTALDPARSRAAAAVPRWSMGLYTKRSHGRQDSDRRSARVRLLNPPTLETTMQVVADRAEAPTAIQTDLRAIFVSLELSRSTWLIVSIAGRRGEDVEAFGSGRRY